MVRQGCALRHTCRERHAHYFVLHLRTCQSCFIEQTIVIAFLVFLQERDVPHTPTNARENESGAVDSNPAQKYRTQFFGNSIDKCTDARCWTQ